MLNYGVIIDQESVCIICWAQKYVDTLSHVYPSSCTCDNVPASLYPHFLANFTQFCLLRLTAIVHSKLQFKISVGVIGAIYLVSSLSYAVGTITAGQLTDRLVSFFIKVYLTITFV